MKGMGSGAHNTSLIYRVPGKIFKKGNVAARAENMSPESHKRRMEGLRKAWDRKVVQVKAGRRLQMAVRAQQRRAKKVRKTMARKLEQIQLLAAQFTEEAIIRAAEIVNDRTTPDSSAIAAAQFLHDRAYGKASQTNINANVNAHGKPSEATASELDRRIAETLQRVEALAGRAPKKKARPPRPTYVREPDRDTDSTPGSGTKH